VAIQVPLAGSYNSALARMPILGPNPPATSTIPLGNKVAVCCSRPVFRLPVVAQVPLAESYNSALAEALKGPPPAIRTIPSGSKVAV